MPQILLGEYFKICIQRSNISIPFYQGIGALLGVWFMSLCMDKRSLSLLGFTLDGAFFVDSIIGLAVGITIVSRLGGRAVFGIQMLQMLQMLISQTPER